MKKTRFFYGLNYFLIVLLGWLLLFGKAAEMNKRSEEGAKRELKEKEKAVRAKEKSLKEKDKAKKQMVLRLSPTLWNEIAAWAEEDFRSINGQVEYLLSECVRKRKGG